MRGIPTRFLGEAIAAFRRQELDAGTIVFDSVHPRWSFVKTNEKGLVIEAAEKRPPSRNATAGFYHFNKVKLLREGRAAHDQ